MLVAAVGDCMFARGVGEHLREAPNDFDMPAIRALLSERDIVLANLESPIAIGGLPDPVQDPNVTFRASPEAIEVLKGIGVNVVSLGNNHMLDYGDAALIETLERLDAAGVARVGAGRTYAEANAPLLMNARGRNVAIIAHSFVYSVNTRMATRRRPGIADYRMSRILPDIRDLAAAGHDVIVSLHWGFEYRFFPLPYQMRDARRMIDAGARLIIGHGPHYPQGIETYGPGEIVYSLGNFIFDEPYRFARRSFVYSAEIDAGGVVTRRAITPIRLRNHVPEIAAGAEQRRLENLINGLDARYQTASPRFWRDHSAAYLTELGGRVLRGRSLKYLRLPPLAFYRDIGPSRLFRLLSPTRFVRAIAGLRRGSAYR